jgi:hypothetical protein
VLGPPPGNRPAQLGNGVQELLGTGVAMDGPLGRGGGEQRREGRLDHIDEIVAPGTDVGALDQAYQPPALEDPSLRRRPLATRAAT